MKEKLPAPAMKKRPQRGLRRLAMHVVALFLVGGLILYLGLSGRVMLINRMDVAQKDVSMEILHAKALVEIKPILQAHADENVNATLDQAISSKKRGLKTTVGDMFSTGFSTEDIYLAVEKAVFEGVAARTDQESADKLQALAREDLDLFKAKLIQEETEALETLSLAKVRKTLLVTETGYAQMYYHAALIAIGGVLLAFAVLLLGIWAFAPHKTKIKTAELLEPIDYLLPFFVGVFIFTLYPIVRVVIMSFQERYRLDGSFQGWGLGNYQYVIHGIPGTSNYFMQGLRNTFLYVIMTVPITTVLAVVIAYLLNQKLRFSALFQTTYFLPMVTSVTAVGLVWRWIFNANFGLLNAILQLFGTTPIDWLGNTNYSMYVLVIFGIWNSLPFTIILLLSGLQNIDETYYTVAKVDGAKALRIFCRITVPLLAPAIGLVLTINSISAFKVFTDVTVLFGGTPGPASNMYTVVYYIYEMMRNRLELGRAAAAAIILFVFIFIFTMLQRYIQRKWNYTT